MPAAPARLTVLDRLRGLAVLLMLLDHGLFLSMTLHPGGDLRSDLRSTVTRFSMPLFMVVSGFLLERTSRRRAVTVLFAALLVSVVLLVCWPEFAQPEILTLWVLLFPLRSLFLRFPLETVVLGVLQVLHLPVGWPGYEPGLVAVFLAVGVLARDRVEVLSRPARLLPRWLEVVGRHSLGVYVFHLVLLAGALVVVRGF